MSDIILPSDKRGTIGDEPLPEGVKFDGISERERIIVVGGVRFYAAMTGEGDQQRRIVTAANESRELLEAAAKVLEKGGWEVKILPAEGRGNEGLFLLTGKDKEPGARWD